MVLEVGGRSITLPDIALCLITDEQVEISAAAAGRTAGVTISWRAEAPAETSIVYTDAGSGLTLVAGPDVAASSPPVVTVDGRTVEILAELHDPALGRPSQMVRLLASCPESPGEEPEPMPEEPAMPSGRASVIVGGSSYDFTTAALCQISSATVTVSFTDGANTFDVIASGGTGFTTLTLDGEQWVAGITGEHIEPAISDSGLAWSGTVATFSGTEAPATFSVECDQ